MYIRRIKCDTGRAHTHQQRIQTPETALYNTYYVASSAYVVFGRALRSVDTDRCIHSTHSCSFRSDRHVYGPSARTPHRPTEHVQTTYKSVTTTHRYGCYTMYAYLVAFGVYPFVHTCIHTHQCVPGHDQRRMDIRASCNTNMAVQYAKTPCTGAWRVTLHSSMCVLCDRCVRMCVAYHAGGGGSSRHTHTHRSPMITLTGRVVNRPPSSLVVSHPSVMMIMVQYIRRWCTRT